jgi:phage major head subunit gpT-like protein
MTTIRENWQELLYTGMSDVFHNTLNGQKDYIPQLFGVKNSDKYEEKALTRGSLGEVPEFNGTVEYDDVAKGWPISFIHKHYAKGIKIEQTMIEDNQYPEALDEADMMALSFYTTRQNHAAGIFNNAFATVLGYDGKVLCATDHPTSPDDSAAMSNKGVLALTSTNLATTRRLMREFKDDRGNPVTVNPDTLIVPLELEETALIVTGSDKMPGTADNDINPQKKVGWNVIVNPFMTDANAWFVADGKLMKRHNRWYNRIKPEFMRGKDIDTLTANYVGRMRYSYGWSGWQWVYGNNPS